MKLRKIVLSFAGALLLSGSAALSQNKLKFDVYSDAFLGLRLNLGSLKVSPKEVDFSFLLGLYSMQFKNINDSTYQEIVKDNWNGRNEFFDYSWNSHYTLRSYDEKKGNPRAEKKALENKVFDKKYESIPELVERFQKGLINDKDSIHIVVLGLPYSAVTEKRKNQDTLIYTGHLEVKRDSGDVYIAPNPIRVYVKDGVPIGFSTVLLDVSGKKEKEIFIEGILKKR